MAPALLITLTCILLTSSALAVNIALYKPADQIGVYGGARGGLGATAYKAVDGRYDYDPGDNYLSVCAHPDTSWDGNVPAKWWVDLNATYSISTVTVYNTYNMEAYQTLNQFIVEVVSSDNTTVQSCGEYNRPEPVNRGDSYTFNCNNKQGRYVYVRKLPGSARQLHIVLCEVIVDGFLGTTTTTTTTTTSTTTLPPPPTTTLPPPPTTTLPPPPPPPPKTTLPPTTMTTTSTSTTTTKASEPKSQTATSANVPATSTTSKPGQTGNQSQSSNNDSTTKEIIIIIVPVIILIVTLIVIAIVLLRQSDIRRCFKGTREKESKMRHAASNNGFTQDTASVASLDEVSVIETEDELEAAQALQDAAAASGNTDIENPYMNTIIRVSEFESYVNLKKSDENNNFDEYKMLPKIDHSRYKIAITDDNKKKNRFLNIYPYDLTRVILGEDNPENENGYINASFIEGYGNTERAYIATQGPVHQTVRDFWRMIWQYNANRIVMVANLTEDGRRKCDRYWPESTNQSETHGEFTLTLESVSEYADYIIRLMKLTKEDESRPIFQYHFTSWKDKGKPSYGAVTLLNFHRKVHAKDDERTGPLVVHCSAGVGRTGTFIALDILLQQMAQERIVDVFGCIQKLRQQRMLMVQTQDQYVFLHDAILEAINVGNTALPCSTLAEDFAEMCEEPENEESELHKQFMLLCKLKNTQEEQYKEGLLEENRDKNRDLTVIPGEHDRPYLMQRGNYKNLYINATYADCFRRHDYYVVTQMPLPSTQADFWRLVYDHHLKSVVMLNDLDQSDQTCKQYWPDEGSNVYGPMKVKHMATATVSRSIVMREFVVTLATNRDAGSQHSPKPLNVRHYQLLGWPNNEVFPPDRGNLLSLIEEVHRWQQQQKHTEDSIKKGQMVVHCLNGVTRSGLFCAVSHIVDKIKLDDEVDAFLAARYVSRRRQQFFQTLEEFKFLYEIALEYISRNHTYINYN